MEKWCNLEQSGFPNYEVSNFGNIRNLQNVNNRKFYLHSSPNQSGAYKVGLMPLDGGPQVKRSLALLVATAFLPPQKNERFNTPINVDGDRSNNRADNLMWRPRWFAIKYHQQFHNDRRGFVVPIIEIHTRETFPTSWEAAIKYGLLDREIANAAINRTYVFPTNKEFRAIE